MVGVFSLKEQMTTLKGKRILITGHTGFKGSWLCQILKNSGALVCGISLPPQTSPNLFELADIAQGMDSHFCDIRDYDKMLEIFQAFQPEIVLHLAAQPIVRESYKNPRYTYETNVMGTVNMLECVRHTSSVKSVLNVTTDKVYQNNEWCWGYRENEPLDGFDPYSNSKSCSELVTHCYNNSFFQDSGVAISTARAGNVIGGGDFSVDRIIPDCVRSTVNGEAIKVRNPNSTRPYQHVLEPLFAYLLIAVKQVEDRGISGYYNVGPDEESCVTTGRLVELFIQYWGAPASWQCGNSAGPHEANFLKLDCSKIKGQLGWKPRWDIGNAVEETVAWYKTWHEGQSLSACMDNQIQKYLGGYGYGR